jgi:hypothetical protein
VAALNQSLVRTVIATEDDSAEIDTFPSMDGDDDAKIQVLQSGSKKGCYVKMSTSILLTNMYLCRHH